ncbi:MAG TPA: methylated-DNA--[protein]-cysteine S-methyltransferase [Pseudonocardiaceae bacterium]|nr:methylated-DNA--[protein]-cysteine S-methyltransferase [Pseudonocardiaceae bacterium]
MRYTHTDSPLGALLLVRDDVGLTGLFLPTGRHVMARQADWVRDDDGFDTVRTQLAEYFAGDRREFDVPLHPKGTEFQTRVWQALLDIPYGETSSYGKQAVTIGAPTAARAVGLANGKNPISIIVPCHRVVGANGSLTGYGGGIDAKQWLLAHEAGHVGLFA